MKTELGDTKEKLEQAQNDLSAWKFTPDRFVILNYLHQMKTVMKKSSELQNKPIIECVQRTVAAQC